jgi:hypothetical protein
METIGLDALAGDIVAESVIVPEKPPILESVRFENPEDPGWRTSLSGIGVKVKS